MVASCFSAQNTLTLMYGITTISQYFKFAFLVGAASQKKWAWSVYKLTIASSVKMDGFIVFLGQKYLGFHV